MKLPSVSFNRPVIATAALFIIVFLMSSCGTRADAERVGCNTRVGIVFDIGGKNDRSFNAAAWEGVKRAEKELPICLYDVEPGNPTSIEPAMRAFAEKNFDLIIGVGFAQGPIMQKVANDYPNIKFAIIDGVIFRGGRQDAEIRMSRRSFSASTRARTSSGMIAAAKSKTGVLGFLGGMDIPLIHRFDDRLRRRRQMRLIRISGSSINYVGVNDARVEQSRQRAKNSRWHRSKKVRT